MKVKETEFRKIKGIMGGMTGDTSVNLHNKVYFMGNNMNFKGIY